MKTVPNEFYEAALSALFGKRGDLQLEIERGAMGVYLKMLRNDLVEVENALESVGMLPVRSVAS